MLLVVHWLCARVVLIVCGVDCVGVCGCVFDCVLLGVCACV